VQVARSVWYLMRKTCVIDAQAQPRAVLPSWKEPEQNVQGDLWSGLPPTKPVRDTVDGEESRLCELHIFSTAPVVLFTQVFIICR